MAHEKTHLPTKKQEWYKNNSKCEQKYSHRWNKTCSVGFTPSYQYQIL